MLDTEALIQLANAHYEAVREYLVEQKGIDPTRISVKEPASSASEDEKFVMMKVDVTVAE